MNTLDEINKILDAMQDASDCANNYPDTVPVVAALRRALPSQPGRRPRDCARLREILSLLEGETE